jgi:hypothetical protein
MERHAPLFDSRGARFVRFSERVGSPFVYLAMCKTRLGGEKEDLGGFGGGKFVNRPSVVFSEQIPPSRCAADHRSAIFSGLACPSVVFSNRKIQSQMHLPQPM